MCAHKSCFENALKFAETISYNCRYVLHTGVFMNMLQSTLTIVMTQWRYGNESEFQISRLRVQIASGSSGDFLIPHLSILVQSKAKNYKAVHKFV